MNIDLAVKNTVLRLSKKFYILDFTKNLIITIKFWCNPIDLHRILFQ